jgi:hypothetical protein
MGQPAEGSQQLFELDQAERARLHLDVNDAGEFHIPLLFPVANVQN